MKIWFAIDGLHSTASLGALVTAEGIGIIGIFSRVITTVVCTIRAIKCVEKIVEGSAFSSKPLSKGAARPHGQETYLQLYHLFDRA